MSAVTAAASALAWGPRIAAMQLVFDALLGLLLVEPLLFRYREIPFASAYVPGRANLKLTFVPYCVGFSLYTSGMADLELRVLASPARFAILAASGALVVALFGELRRRGLTRAARQDARAERGITPLGLGLEA